MEHMTELGKLATQYKTQWVVLQQRKNQGAGEFSINEKIRFYRMAKRSATECAGILDICVHLNLVDENIIHRSRDLLLLIVSMLTKMARVSSGTHAGTHTFT